MNILATYRTHKTIGDMDISVENHIARNKGKLTPSDIKVLRCLASHSLTHVGACKLKGQTIADEIGISRSTVTRSIKKLKDLHVIAVHNDVKGNGIKGANIYTIIFLHVNAPSSESTKMNHRAVYETPRSSKFEHVKIESESLPFNQSFNLSVKSVSNNVNACVPQDNLKEVLKAIYSPHSVEGKRTFEELCKIAFGRLKQYMKSHKVPYLQLEGIIVKAMQDLVNKPNVRNQFAMYSSMIKRQVEQLFEQPIQPQITIYKPNQRNSKEIIPDWFNNRNQRVKPSTSDIDFEAERQKFLAKLG